mgnify:CR=1 FL=1
MKEEKITRKRNILKVKKEIQKKGQWNVQVRMGNISNYLQQLKKQRQIQ